MSLKFDAQALEHVVRRFYRAAAAQFIHQFMLFEELSTITGQAFINQDRLVVERFPLRAMQSCLVLEILLTVTMVALAPRNAVIPRNSNTIFATAQVLANSETLRRASGHWRSANGGLGATCCQLPILFTRIGPQRQRTIYHRGN